VNLLVATLTINPIKALIKKNIQLTILSRSPAKSVPEGARAIQVSYTDVFALAAVLKENKVDVLISTVPGAAIESQYAFVDAAVEAGVQFFVPSEFGMPTAGNTDSHTGRKAKVSSYSQGKGLPYALFYVRTMQIRVKSYLGLTKAIQTGYFFEYIDWLAGFEQTGKIHILGKGDIPCSWTDLEDIGGEYFPYMVSSFDSWELNS
jgi:hypothetical protein